MLKILIILSYHRVIGDFSFMIDASGTIQATYYYDAFGNIMMQTGNVNNPFTYAGYQYDNESGLYYLNARYYDPVTARFITEDSYLGDKYDPLSLNLYTYCHNEPIMYVDPSGHTEAQLRDLVAAAGGEVGWNNETRTATATINGVEKKFKIEDFKVEDGRIIIDSNKFDSMFSNNKVSISSRVESKKITATTVTNSSGSYYGGKTETISSSVNNYQKSSSLIKPVSNGMSNTEQGIWKTVVQYGDNLKDQSLMSTITTGGIILSGIGIAGGIKSDKISDKILITSFALNGLMSNTYNLANYASGKLEKIDQFNVGKTIAEASSSLIGEGAELVGEVFVGKKLEFNKAAKNFGGVAFEVADIAYSAQGVYKGVKVINDTAYKVVKRTLVTGNMSAVYNNTSKVQKIGAAADIANTVVGWTQKIKDWMK